MKRRGEVRKATMGEKFFGGAVIGEASTRTGGEAGAQGFGFSFGGFPFHWRGNI